MTYCRPAPSSLLAVVVLVPLLAALPALPAAAQQPSDTFAGETTVTVVEVPVQVVEDGKPVTGLGPQDFRIYDQGELREIQSVEQVDLRVATAAGSSAEAAELAPAARRHFLLLFDLAFTDAAYLARAAGAARDLVEEGLHPTDLVAVAFFNLREGVSSVVGFTSDHGQALRALKELEAFLGVEGEVAEGEVAERGGPDPLRLTVGEWEAQLADIGVAAERTRSGGEDAMEVLGANAAGGGRGGDLGGLEAMLVIGETEMREIRASEASALVTSLGDLAESMRWVEGAKYLVLFSRGFESTTFQEENSAWLLAELNQAIEQFRRAGWSIHAVETTGTLNTGNRRQRREALFFLAEETGGVLLENEPDLSHAMGRVLEQTSVTYVLTFQTPELPMDGSFRNLRVELAGDAARGARVFHRAGYFVPKPFAELSAEERRSVTAELVLAGQEVEEIGCRVLVSPAELTEGRARVPVVLDVDSLSLLAGRNWQATRVEALAYAFDQAGQVGGTWGASFFITPNVVRRAERAGSVVFYGELDLAPGEYQVRTLVRNVEDGRVTLRNTKVRVPEPGEGGPTLLEPIFADVVDPDAEESGTRILVRDVGQGEGYPFTFGDKRFLPRVGPALVAGAETTLISRGLWQEAPQGLRVLVFDANGFPAPGASVRFLGQDEASAGAVRQLALAFRPSGLPPGDYQLRLVYRDSGGGTVSSPPAPFRVVDPALSAW
jgi:VWFA-related protein